MRSKRSTFLTLALALGLFACSDGAEPQAQAPSEPAREAGPDAGALAERAELVFGTLPAEAPNEDNPITEAKIELGRMLYYDTRLSKGQDISCNSCHMLDRFGVDNEPTSPGHKGQRGGRNSPSTYNAAIHLAQFWDGREPDVEAQAGGPITNPIEMAMPSQEATEAVLRSIPGYVERFAEAFPGEEQPVTYRNATLAIGAFERRLFTPGRFDQFLAGDEQALAPEELAGLETFIETGCTTCHQGAGVGGAMYQKLGLVHPYETADTGRQQVTGQPQDAYFFKVPSLRNVAETGPYFHDGSIATLEEAVRLMAHHQLGRELSDADLAAIVTFLESLTGEVDEEYVAKPELPPSSDATPGPDLS